MHDPQQDASRPERSSPEPSSLAKNDSARFRDGRAIPVTAVALACTYLAAAVGTPLLLAVVVVAATLAGAALARAYAPPRRFTRTLIGLALWLALGFVGAWLLCDRPLGGLAWVLIVIYLVPLPLIPWLFAKTFESGKVRRFEGARPSGDRT